MLGDNSPLMYKLAVLDEQTRQTWYHEDGSVYLAVEIVTLEGLASHQEHLRGLIAEHLELTGSNRAEQILANFDLYMPMFKLVKPKSSDVKSLLGHRARSSAELRVQAQ